MKKSPGQDAVLQQGTKPAKLGYNASGTGVTYKLGRAMTKAMGESLSRLPSPLLRNRMFSVLLEKKKEREREREIVSLGV